MQTVLSEVDLHPAATRAEGAKQELCPFAPDGGAVVVIATGAGCAAVSARRVRAALRANLRGSWDGAIGFSSGKRDILIYTRLSW